MFALRVPPGHWLPAEERGMTGEDLSQILGASRNLVAMPS